MTGKDKGSASWHQTLVTIRPDIYRLALERKIDISDACNRALASLTGSEYAGNPQEPSPAQPPVIIAKDGASPQPAVREKKTVSRKMHPVINADDPAAPAKVAEAKTLIKEGPAADVPAPPLSAPAPEEKPVKKPVAGKAGPVQGRGGPKRQSSKTGALNTFFSKKISRTGDAGDHVGRDEFYELFVRFCRDNRLSPVMERKAVMVALKTRFALSETMVDGNQVWTGIRVK